MICHRFGGSSRSRKVTHPRCFETKDPLVVILSETVLLGESRREELAYKNSSGNQVTQYGMKHSSCVVV